jgi:ADP-ribose pyrophosphatase YjhB (NUDIX family)
MMTITFSLLVIRHPTEEKLFALVDEGERGWWLPGGGVDGHETFDEGGRREALEEAGVEVEANLSLLRIEVGYQRLRYILTGKAKSSTLKTVPDKESNGARWITVQDVQKLANGQYPVSNSRLRGTEPMEWFSYMKSGGTAFPIDDSFVERTVEPGTKGMNYAGRAVFLAQIACVIACLVISTGEFIVDPSSSEIRLPRFEPRLQLGETLNDRAKRGLKELGVTDNITGVVAIRDVRNAKNELDLRVSYLVPIQTNKMNTATASEFKDPFDRRTIERVMAKLTLAPVTFIGGE